MGEPAALKRLHAQRLREVYRSAGWPFQDIVEVDLLAAGLLERITSPSGHELVRVTDAGIMHLANATEGNRSARSAHENLEPVVHEIKVNRADLLGDLKRPEKRQAYLDVGGQCWYVLGCNARGRPIAEPDEVPTECGVMLFQNGQLEILRVAPKKPASGLPFPIWMALAKANPVQRSDVESSVQDFLRPEMLHQPVTDSR